MATGSCKVRARRNMRDHVLLLCPYPILQMRKLRLKEGTRLVSGHPGQQRQCWDQTHFLMQRVRHCFHCEPGTFPLTVAWGAWK